MARDSRNQGDDQRQARGFEPAARIVDRQITKSGSRRAYSVARVAQRWPEIAGQAIADISQPLRIRSGFKGRGATLWLSTTSARAQELRMDIPRLIDRVNAVYGFRAIGTIRVVQTDQLVKPPVTETDTASRERAIDPALVKDAVAEIKDDELRQLLENLGHGMVQPKP